MTIQTYRNGRRFELPDSGKHPDQVYGFDDVPRYSMVKLRGDTGYVLDKGSHITSGDDRHIQISFEPDCNRDETNLHERLVNKYLHEKKFLFVDFTGDMMATTETDIANVRRSTK